MIANVYLHMLYLYKEKRITFYFPWSVTIIQLEENIIVTFQVTIKFGLGFMSFCGGYFEFC